MATYNLNIDTHSNEELPFRLHLRFHKLFDHWEEMAKSKEAGQAKYAQEVLKKMDAIPELRAPIEDLQLLDKYEAEIGLLLSAIFPTALSQNEIKAVGLPFTPIFFNPSTRFARILDEMPKDFVVSTRSFEADVVYINSCVFILNKVYQLGLDFRRPYYFNIPDAKGVMHSYRIFINIDFTEFRLADPDFHLSPQDIEMLIDNIDDIDLWKKKIPPHTFELVGFALLNMFDVSIDQILSELKNDLLRPDALQNEALFNGVQQKISQIFGIPDLRFGYAFLNETGDTLIPRGNNPRSLLFQNLEEVELPKNLLSEKQMMTIKSNRPVALSNLKKTCSINNHPMLQRLLDQNLGSYLMAPIKEDGVFIGIFELGAIKRGALNTVVANKLEDFLSLFTIALQRSYNEYHTRLEAIIQEQCTSIHPAVSWRFFEEADRFLQTELQGVTAQMSDISFENIYPLYGQSDIKGSSTERNRSIQEDLLEQLRLAAKVVKTASNQLQLPILDELKYRIKTFSDQLKRGLRAGDEVNMLAFLKLEVYPVFQHLQTLNEELFHAVDTYIQHLDPELGVLYQQRKKYESSVTWLNDSIDCYLDKQQDIAQKMFPHYFETYKTDGVEHNIYIGAALVKNRPFAPLYLQNLRLWQLLTICGIENVVHHLKPKMETPLDVASLVLVHSSPLSIKFKMSEKRFDVDGAYNARYEIVKKRIDKAHIKGTTERLTQVGKIAIVYTQDQDAEEYRRYLEYLLSIKKIKGKIEYLDLEDLQGVSGLKALRVEVVYQKDFKQEEYSMMQSEAKMLT